MMATSIVDTVRDAAWLAHRYDPGHDAFHFRHVSRGRHGTAVFITDQHLGVEPAPVVIGRRDALAVAPPVAPLHFVFHSAFCCSTLVAKAVDVPGRSMGLKEPVVLNDLIGWKHRGGAGTAIGAALDAALRLLARPFAPGEAVVVKPSNIVTALYPAMLKLRPEARALLLYAPLPEFLASIAKKGIEGRLWVRDLFVGLYQDKLIQPLGLDGFELLKLTDLQAAAAGWLAQHAVFARLAAAHPDRVRTIDSERLLKDPAATMSALGRFYAIDWDAAAIGTGPVFTRDAKGDRAFDAAARRADAARAADLHADEVDKVVTWTEALAAAAGVPLTLPAPLL